VELGALPCLNAVAQREATRVVAVGEQGVVVTYDPGGWTAVPPTVEHIAGTALYGVAGGLAGLLFASGKPVPSFIGRWQTMPGGHSPVHHGRSPRSPGVQHAGIFAVGVDGVILTYRVPDWQIMASPTTIELRGIHLAEWCERASACGQSETMLAVGGRGTILRLNGSAWVPTDSGTEVDLYAVWGARGSNPPAVVVGAKGTVVELVPGSEHHAHRTPLRRELVARGCRRVGHDGRGLRSPPSGR